MGKPERPLAGRSPFASTSNLNYPHGRNKRASAANRRRITAFPRQSAGASVVSRSVARYLALSLVKSFFGCAAHLLRRASATHRCLDGDLFLSKALVVDALQASYGLAVLIGGLLLLTVLVYRGQSIFVVAPLCALLVLALSGEDPVEGMTGRYMTGFADYLRRFYLIFALGASFGKLMEHSGAAARSRASHRARVGK